MGSRATLTRIAVVIWSLLSTLAWSPAWALTLNLGGYSQSPLLTMSTSASGLEVGADGTLYLFSGSPASIRKVSSAGTESPWSSAEVVDLAPIPSGGAIGAGASACSCLVRIEPNGSYSTFARDSVQWFRVAVGLDGTIFGAGAVNGPSGPGAMVFRIDAVSGQRTLLASASFISEYISLAVAGDGDLYAIKYSTYPQRVLARFDGSQFTPILVLPHSGHGLTRGTDGIFWAMTTWDYGSGYPIGEIWALNFMSLDATLFAQTSWVDAGFWGVGHDPTTSRLYIGDPSHRLLQPSPVLQTVTGGLLPARSHTWGSIKARYRGASPGGAPGGH